LDGKPLPNATVRFIPIADDGKGARKGASVAMGVTDDSGHYRLFYVKDTMGAAIGPNVVAIEAKDTAGHEQVRRDFNATVNLAAGGEVRLARIGLRRSWHRRGHAEHRSRNANSLALICARSRVAIAE